jgi:amino acid adenylation domain-containing protein
VPPPGKPTSTDSAAGAGRLSSMSADAIAFPLSFAQQRLWFLDQLEPGAPLYNISCTYRIGGALDRDALRRALAAVVARHEVLRTTFAVVDERPVQRIAVEQALDLPLADIRAVPEPERDRRGEAWIAEGTRRAFDLSRGPLLRASLLQLGDEDHLLLLAMHHIVCDGWSIQILLKELAVFYREFSGGSKRPLAELPIQYSDFARWQREWLSGSVLEAQLSFWRSQLAGLSMLELPTDRPRPAAPSFRVGRVSVSFPSKLTAGLKELSRREGATLYMTLLASFGALLARYTGQEDVVVGSPIAGRNHADIEGLIGFFVNMLVLRLDVSGDPSFREVLRRVRGVALDAYEHQDLPFERLVEELQPQRSVGQNPLVRTTLALQNTPGAKLDLPGARSTLVSIETPATYFDLEVHVFETPDSLVCEFLYATDLFDSETIERMARHYGRVLEGVVRDAGARVSELAILSDGERRQVLEEWNQTEREYPRDQTVHGLFERQVERTPDSVAVVFGNERLTYAQLNDRANRVANFLRKRGVGPEVLVGLCVERSPEMVVGLLGILKAGGAYVPLDPDYPARRLAAMLEDAGAPVVLTQKSVSGALPEGRFETVCLDADWPEILRESGENPPARATPDDLAYVIFTSGSTGVPKGVEIPHAALSNHMFWMQEAFPLGLEDRVLQKTPISFDASVWEFFAPLCAGARLVVANPADHRDPASLVETILAHGITVLQVVPSLLRMLLDQEGFGGCRSLKRVFCGGEPLTSDLRDRFFGALSAELHNLYGPTEATIDAACWTCRREDRLSSVPIGRAIANLRAYVLDARGGPVPIGVGGELHLGGAGLARGYRNRTDLTAERFVADPFRPESPGRLYRTGDRVRWRPDGVLEYLGRLDHQIKLRGFRIEIEEIEMALLRHPGVRACAVSVWRESPGNESLVGYIVAPKGVMTSAADLRAFLKASLPDHMIPSLFAPLESLPSTPSGKIDRRALPAPDPRTTIFESGSPAPRTPIERALAEIWSEVLGVERVGVEDNFFALGGHSLLATQVFSRLRKAFRVGLPLRVLFETPTIAGLAAAVEAAQSAGG